MEIESGSSILRRASYDGNAHSARWVIVYLTITISVLAWFAISRSVATLTLLNLDVWRAISGKAHGGEWISLDGVLIYYETFGKGPPVLVLHGGTGRHETMGNQIEALSSDHFVVAPDSRGHGLSSDEPGPLHYDDMTADMIGLMNHLHIAKADVVGWSDGGIVGLDMAIRHPDRVRSLVAIGANFDVAGLKVSSDPAHSRLDPLAVLRAIYRRLVARASPREKVRDQKVYRLWRTEPHFTVSDLARIRCPVLVMAGEHDKIRPEHTDALARAIPGAREVIIAGADHLAPLHDARPVNAQIRSFLAGS